MSYRNVNFECAKWVSTGGKSSTPVIRTKIRINKGEKAVITIGCLGMTELYINGVKVSDDLLLPLNTDFHERKGLIYNGIPFNEELNHRLYCPVYDISEYLNDGENALCFMVGPGWYELPEFEYHYGNVKLCWKVEITDENGNVRNEASCGTERWKESFVKESNIIYGEKHDYSDYDDKCLDVDFDDSSWEIVTAEETPKTNYYIHDCPADKVIRRIIPKRLSGNIYDAGELITGFAVIRSKSGKAESIKVRYSELLNGDGALMEEKIYGQHTDYITDGTERLLYPKFTWLCFRYFEVTGDAEVLECAVVHSDVKKASEFECSEEILNWLYNAYIRTQLNNMHCGIPSDCPHTERRGYTGDGQLVSGAAMLQLDAQKFYKKWIYDISDCQDRLSGHVQYTAPFIQSGGGPGGWGCAIVVVPYEYYKNYGDVEILKEMYPQMLKWFEFMDAHSENEIVTSDRENVWFLGDWCTPAQNKFNKLDAMIIPASYVNTYFYIKSLELFIKIGKIIGNRENEEDINDRINRKKQAMTDCFFDERTGDFAENEQGANAFAVDLGLGDERTFEHIIKRYRKIKHYDTGIFGTDILTRILFEKGYEDLAISLLTSKEEISFYTHMKNGATTLPEYWNGVRSQCHPMFGAVTKYLFQYILGIRQTENSAAYASVIIEPKCMDIISKAKGSINTVKGGIFVEYDENSIKIDIPESIHAVFRYKNKDIILKPGFSIFEK